MGVSGMASLPANHPIFRLEKKVGRFAHLLPASLVADMSYWRQVNVRVGDKQLVCPEKRHQIPTVLLPIFKRMLDVPFDMLVSIPRAGDPLGFALMQMSEASQKIGFPVAKIPLHESFGGGRSPLVANFNFFSSADRERIVSPAAKKRVQEMIGGFSRQERRHFIMYRGSLELFERALDQNLSAVLHWFARTGHPHFIRVAIPVLAELVGETDLAVQFREYSNNLIIDDCTQDLDAYRTVKYPLSVFAPQANVEVGLMSGNKDDEKDINAICGSLRGGWGMMKGKDPWTGEKGQIQTSQVSNRVIEMLTPGFGEITQGIDSFDLRGALSVLVTERLYKMGQLFAQRTSWEREWVRAGFENKHGRERLSGLSAFIQRELTSSIVGHLRSSSPLFSRMNVGRRDVERGIEDLFERSLDQRLLKAYLGSDCDYQELRPISDLLALMNQ